MSPFETSDYKRYVQDQIERNKKVRGYQSKLARAAGCQKSYFSHVLHSHNHFSPDQGAGLATFWNFSAEETDWFLELLHLARAQTEVLKRRIRERLKEMRARRENLAPRFNKPRLDEMEKESLYYSSWHWSALHILTSIPAYRKVNAISERLSLSKNLVRDSLVKLEGLELVKRRGDEWHNVPGGLYVPKGSLFSRNHHFNWRQRALLDCQQDTSDAIHYSDICSISFNDYEKLKEMFVELIDNFRKIVKPSKEEEMVAFCLDFFRS